MLVRDKHAMLCSLFACAVCFLIGFYLQTKFGAEDFAWLHRQKSDSEAIWREAKAQRALTVQKHGTLFDANPWWHYGPVLWDFFAPAYNCPRPIERVGDVGNGGYWVCGFSAIRRKKPCVVYSYGISNYVSFEEDILQRSECIVRMFDHTINPEIAPAPFDLVRRYPGRAELYLTGLGGVDSDQIHTLRTDMSLHNDRFLDILKVDVEGYEFDALRSMVADFPDGLPFAQLPIELHIGFVQGNTFRELVKWFNYVEDVGGLRGILWGPNLVQTLVQNTSVLTCMEYIFINSKIEPEYYFV